MIIVVFCLIIALSTLYTSPVKCIPTTDKEVQEMKTLSTILAITLGLAAFAGLGMALNPLQGDDWALDPDMDGLNNRDEFLAGSDPNNWDTDGDGLPDGWEVDNSIDPTDPLDAEDDNDYFGGEEYASYSQVEPPYDNYDEFYRLAYVDTETGRNVYIPTDPNNPDTDGDGILDPDDANPWVFGEPPIDPSDIGNPTPPKPNPGPPIPPDAKDTDRDGLPDLLEFTLGTDPYNPDTDGDGLLDPAELRLNLDPNDWDTDNDLLIDGVEEGQGGSTDGHLTDTDNDGL